MEKLKKILVVEDDRILLKLIKKSLAKENFEVHCANNGEKGLAMAEKLIPEILLIDVVMPKKDGLSILREVRKTKWGKSIPIVVWTNLGEQEIKSVLAKEKSKYLAKAETGLGELIKYLKAL